MKTKLVVCMLSAALSGSIMAADGIEIGGNLNQTVKATSLTATTTAGGGIFNQRVGVITGDVKVKGNLNQNITAGPITSTMSAGGGRVQQEVGVISGGTDKSITSIFK